MIHEPRSEKCNRKRIFISSTIYDLVDVRAEAETELWDNGMMPVISGSSTADFYVHTDRSSIEACLENLRCCDAVVLLLCRRYGPRLGSVGYPNVSATHLEFMEAKKQGKPLFVYVRDRLEADYWHWHRNREEECRLSWVQTRNDLGILELLDEHRTLRGAGENNWYTTFRDSLELKRLLRRDLQRYSARASTDDTAQNVDLSVKNLPCQNGVAAQLLFTNRTMEPIHDFQWHPPFDGLVHGKRVFPAIGPKCTAKIYMIGPLQDRILVKTAKAQYRTAGGNTVADMYRFEYVMLESHGTLNAMLTDSIQQRI